MNDGDADHDGIPDFADVEIAGAPEEDAVTFTPLILEIPEGLDEDKALVRFTYSASDPAGVSGSGTADDPYVPASGHLRIWKADIVRTDGAVIRNVAEVHIEGGQFVQTDTDYTIADLGSGPKISFFIEGIQESVALADQQITVAIDPNGEHEEPECIGKDAVRVTIIRAVLDLDAHWPGTMDEPGLPVSDAEEDDPLNLYMAVNDDDDNFDTVADNDPIDSPTIEGEDDDLVRIVIRKFTPLVSGEGTLELRLSDGLRLFTVDGTQELSGPLSVDFANPIGPLAGVGNTDVTFLVDATQASKDIVLSLVYLQAGQDIARDNVHITVLNPVMTGEFTRGSIRYSQAEKVNSNWVVCGELTPHRPLSLLVEHPMNPFYPDGVPVWARNRFMMKYGVSTKRDFFDWGKWNRPEATTEGPLVSEQYFEVQAALYNGLILPLNALLQLLGEPLLEPYTADTLAEMLSQESNIPKEELLKGKYFVTSSINESGRGVIEFFFDNKTFIKEDLYILKLDLDIHHGGQDRTEVPDAEEETRGAITLANLNDSDEDGEIDKDDSTITTSAWWWPFNEKGDPDMLKLVIQFIEPTSLVNDLKLVETANKNTVSLTVNSDSVKLWGKPTKEGTDLCASNEPCTFDLSDIEKVLWVEAIEPSMTHRDIQIDLKYLGAKDTVRATAIWETESVADLDIDSDNNNGFALPPLWGRSEYEDSIEDEPEQPGKFITVNDGDADNDGIPDFADFETSVVYPGNTPVRFTPLVLELPEPLDLEKLKIRLTYSASAPSGVTGFGTQADPYAPAPGHLRIWKVDGSVNRNITEVSPGGAGHYVKPNSEYKPSALGPDRTITLFVEGITESSSIADQQIKVEIDPNGDDEEPGFIGEDTVRVTVIRVDLDIDSDNNDRLNEPDQGDYEDQIENIQDDANRPGKMIGANIEDFDYNNGVPNFADGIDKYDNEGTDVNGNFVPLILELPEPLDVANARIRLTYSASDPAKVERRNGVGTLENPHVYSPAPGHLRIWTVNGPASRKVAEVNVDGHFVASGVIYNVTDFELADRTITLFVEGIDGSAELADQLIMVEIDPNDEDEEPGFLCEDRVRLTVIKLEITEVDLPNDGVSFTTRDEPPDHVENEITLTANIEPDSLDATYNSQIRWEIRDNPAVNGESPVPNILDLQGQEVRVEMNIANDADGRGDPLNYRIQARFTILEGTTVYSQWQPVQQDKMDQLRQEYLDIVKYNNDLPERADPRWNTCGGTHFTCAQWREDSDYANFSLQSTDIEGGVNLIYNSIAADYPGGENNIEITSGYRNPMSQDRIDRQMGTNCNNCRHVQGRAIDLGRRDVNNDGSIDAVDTVVLSAAASNAGAWVKDDYADGHVHAHW